ncbi:S1 RNA-binding domain-containing protein [Clostridium sp. MT-14]|jgi:predicted RNA-binding protein (virulence factor B family)|uniref:S1-like domain-containing RNA-binding protein n=1 Tax=Clostridium aromativorans TaxID=2836848 RepID=A0ABS8N2Q4_9CLOT|nr:MULTISPECIES: S1-like domain-containing RNA-binding protein [Clostridium]KAA8676561.1 DNA-binding protein [Clostridium sp. HV4-5-A1G]MCC9294086.1 S1-like domain-containing RNA-binding protein [Clostridium aromativorans]CAB1239580.1 DNA-binding protein [Clostridiaceae bacterium BL-3]
MVSLGKFNLLKIARKTKFGYYLDAKTGSIRDDILLPNKNTLGKELSIGDELNAFIYKDSKDKIIATLKSPLAQVGEIALLKTVSQVSFGYFIGIGLERDVLVPISEQKYKLILGKCYPFYLYLDKTNRIAATTDIDRYLLEVEEENEKYNIGAEVKGIVYGFQTNNSAMVVIDKKYKGVILRNEYFTKLNIGDELNLRIKRIYEDGKLGLTPRKTPKYERLSLEDTILDYLKSHGGFMPYNDKSSPEDIKTTFHESKNYFKNALGGLMKRNLIFQDENGTKLIK